MPVYKVQSPVVFVEADDIDAAVEIGAEHIASFPLCDYTVEVDSDSVQ